MKPSKKKDEREGNEDDIKLRIIDCGIYLNLDLQAIKKRSKSQIVTSINGLELDLTNEFSNIIKNIHIAISK